MSRAEERALETYPVIMHTLIPMNDDAPEIEQDCNKFHRQAYIEGYHQAEKDLELTWKDIMKIETLCFKVDIRCDLEARYQEILKRFKEIKK